MPTKQIFPKWIWIVYLILFALSIPWYLPKGVEMSLLFGLPAWLIACILSIFIIAIFSVWVIHRFWNEET